MWTFRPRYNAARLAASARRLALPELPEEDFIASLVDLVRADEAWVPDGEGRAEVHQLRRDPLPLLPKLRGHFAEFLNHSSPERLSILYLTTCVGFQYGLDKPEA